MSRGGWGEDNIDLLGSTVMTITKKQSRSRCRSRCRSRRDGQSTEKCSDNKGDKLLELVARREQDLLLPSQQGKDHEQDDGSNYPKGVSAADIFYAQMNGGGLFLHRVASTILLAGTQSYKT
jgi:hypothetical protein